MGSENGNGQGTPDLVTVALRAVDRLDELVAQGKVNNGTLHRMETHAENTSRRLVSIEGRMASIENKMDEIVDLKRLQDLVMTVSNEIRERLTRIEQRLGE